MEHEAVNDVRIGIFIERMKRVCHARAYCILETSDTTEPTLHLFKLALLPSSILARSFISERSF